MAIPGPHSADRLRRQYSFGEFTLDLDGGFLRRGRDEVALRPKRFEVLVYLMEHHGRLVTKTELTDVVWPDAAVVDNSLAQCLVEVRRALGDDSQQNDSDGGSPRLRLHGFRDDAGRGVPTLTCGH